MLYIVPMRRTSQLGPLYPFHDTLHSCFCKEFHNTRLILEKAKGNAFTFIADDVNYLLHAPTNPERFVSGQLLMTLFFQSTLHILGNGYAMHTAALFWHKQNEDAALQRSAGTTLILNAEVNHHFVASKDGGLPRSSFDVMDADVHYYID